MRGCTLRIRCDHLDPVSRTISQKNSITVWVKESGEAKNDR